MHKTLRVIAVVASLLLFAACGFVGTEPITAWDPPGLFSGVWHGLLAPWSLILRLFLDI